MKTHDEMIRDLYARRDAYELQKQKQKRKIKRTAVRLSCIAACFAVCLTVGLGVYQETKAPDEKTESSETTQQTPSDSAGESEDDEWSQAESSEVLDASSAESSEPEKEIPEWLQAAYDSYAVAEIVGVTDETVTVDGTEYTKVNCNVMQTYRADAFAECDTMYIVSHTAQQIDALATVFFELQELTVDGTICYTTTADENGAVCLGVYTAEESRPIIETSYNAEELLNKLEESIVNMCSFLQYTDAEVSAEMFMAYEDIIALFELSYNAVDEYEKREMQ